MKKFYFKFLLGVLLIASMQLSAQDYVQFMVNYNTEQCSPVTVSLNNYSSFSFYTGTVNYEWYIDNGLFSSVPYPDSLIVNAGYHDLHLIAKDTLGVILGDYLQNILIKGYTHQFYTDPNIAIVPGQPISFFTNDYHQWVVWKLHNGNILKYNWAKYTYTTPGIFPVKMTIGGECGIDSVIQFVTVDASAKPITEIWISNDYICPNDEIILKATPAFQSEWNIGGTILYGQEIFYAFADTGTYEIILKNTNEGGNSDYDTVFVHAQNNIYVSAEFMPQFTLEPCPNNKLKFEAASAGTFEWDFGDGSTGFGKRVFNTYVDTGIYYVTLYASNGCGTQDTMTYPLSIMYNPMSYVPFPEFYIKDQQDPNQTSVTICPFEEITFIRSSGSQEGVTYRFIIDSTEYEQEEVTHIFSEPGFYEVKLIAENNCGGSQMNFKMVFVDSNSTPMVNIGVVPKIICPGEAVYFFDDYNKSESGGPVKMTYSINFGDGNTLSNITHPVGDKNFLAIHPYTLPGIYPATITATNTCGNEVVINDTVIVNNNPSRIPFYYTHNTSTSDELESEFENWGVIPNKQYTTFNIDLGLSDWNYCGDMDSSIYVFFWYGYLNMSDPSLGPPNGYVEIKAPGTAVAYIPFNVVKPSVGMAAVWYCNKDYFEKDPQVYTIPFDSVLMQEIQSFPTIPGQTFNYPHPLVLNGLQWMNLQSCMCEPPTSKLRGDWSYQTNDGYYHILNIYENENGTLKFDASAGPDPMDYNRTIFQSGNINMMSDSTIELMDTTGNCFEMGLYEFSISMDDQLTFTFNYDMCMNRVPFLVQESFIKTDYNNTNYKYKSGCPGDTIGFEIMGGLSYEWHIRGNTNTSPTTYYVYPDTGKFEEFVIATNACGRIDTIYTTVLIGESNIPEPEWFISKSNAKRFEPINFGAYIRSEYNNYLFHWDFGDGTSSTESNPSHFYSVEGEYIITLTVENGCGQFTDQKYIYITKETSVCEAKFVYSSTGTNVTFIDKSLGNITSYFWEFGDGRVSTLPNPVYIYPAEGIYLVTLTVYDENNDCSNQIRKQIMVGNIGCLADFNFTVNNITKTVVFNNFSSGDISEYYWNFGDGNFSDDSLPENTYAREGTYWVCLTTFDTTTNCMSEVCKMVTIGNPEIVAEFNYRINPQTNTVDFSDISSGTITNWYWDFGDGNWDTIPEPTHSYETSGEYNVCLSVYNSGTNGFADICKTVIMITDTSVISTKADYTYFVNPTTRKVDFTDKSTGDITNWYWTFGDGSYLAGENVSKTYTAPGMYNVCLVVFNSTTGERSEICKTIQVGAITCNINAEFGYFINPLTKQVTFSDKTTGTAHKWFWDFGNGKTSSQKNPIHTYTNSGFYLVSLAVRDTINNCTDYYANFLQIGTADCKADFNFTITDIGTNTVKFTDKSIGTIGSYFWYFNDGNFSTIKDPSNSYSTGGLYSVSLTVTDNSGLCMDYISKDVQVGSIDCNADFEIYIDSMTNEVFFNNQTVAAGTSLYWLFGDGTYWIGPNPEHTYTAPGYYNVSLNTFNPNNGCMDYEQKVLLIGSPGNDVNADFIYSANLATRAVNFSNKSNGQNLTYVWNLGDGSTSTLKDPEHTYATGGYKFVCLTARNSVTGMQNTTCKLVQVSSEASSNCLARFNYDVNNTTLTVKFIDKSYGTPNQFYWDFGDSTSSTSQNPTKVYSEAGYYLVGLKTKNATGCESFEYEIVNVNAGTGIQAMFAYIVDTTAGRKPGGKPVDMIGVGHGGGSQLGWNFGDGTTKNSKSVDSTTLRPTHLYENPGLYKACLTISDPIINQSDTFCNYIAIPYETIATEAICEGTSYNFLGNVLTIAGEYVDTTTSFVGVDSIVYLTLTVNPAPVKPTAALSGTTITSSTATSYQWYKDGTLIAGATNQSYVATVSGNYTVIVTNTNGCHSDPSEPVNVVISGIEDLNPFNLKVFPNPMQAHTRIEYYLSSTQQINITLYDVAGNSIETIVNTYKPAGDHYIVWRNPGLANGIYYLVMTSNTDKSTTKLVIQK